MIVIDKITSKSFRTEEEYEEYLKLVEKEKKGGETMKVIRQEDKNFEEEKIEMFQPRTLNKEEQLRLVFSHLLTALILEARSEVKSGKDESITEKYTNIFIKEVKIRVKLQEEL